MKTTRRLLLSLAPLALLQYPNQTLGMSYSVKGNLSYQLSVLQAHGEPLKRDPLLREFEVLVGDCAWKIKGVCVGSIASHSIISYDRTNLLEYSIPPEAWDGPTKTVTVEASPVPATTSTAGEYAWLAFASGCYFKDQTNNRALSFARPKSRHGFARRYEVPCRVALSSSPPHLPTAIEYISTNQVISVRDDGTLSFVPLPPSFGNSGYTSAEFKSGGFTNIQGLSFPTHFEYRKYRPQPDAKTTNDLRCVLIIRGEVTSISTKEQRVDCALPAKSFMLWDLRVPDHQDFYRIDDGQIPALDSEYKAERERALIRFEQNGE